MNARALEVVELLLRQPRVDPRTEQGRIEGLRQVVVCPDLDAADDAVDLVDGRDHDHRDVLGAGCRLELLERPRSRRAPGMRMSRSTTSHVSSAKSSSASRTVRRRSHLVAVGLEQAPKQLPADVVVVGDQDRSRHRPDDPPSRANGWSTVFRLGCRGRRARQACARRSARERRRRPGVRRGADRRAPRGRAGSARGAARGDCGWRRGDSAIVRRTRSRETGGRLVRPSSPRSARKRRPRQRPASSTL